MQTRARLLAASVLSLAVLATSACGDSGDDKASDSTSTSPSTEGTSQASGAACTADDIEVTGGFGEKPTITIPDDCSPPTTLLTKDLVTGSGPKAAQGGSVESNYHLVTWSDKQVLDRLVRPRPDLHRRAAGPGPGHRRLEPGAGRDAEGHPPAARRPAGPRLRRGRPGRRAERDPGLRDRRGERQADPRRRGDVRPQPGQAVGGRRAGIGEPPVADRYDGLQVALQPSARCRWGAR
nr:hypothetical protein [Nocardioides convexus]